MAENKKGVLFRRHPVIIYKFPDYFSLSSEETVSFFLPLALRAERTLLPFAVDILSLKPCLFDLFLLDG
jgi:hypothetical protein